MQKIPGFRGSTPYLHPFLGLDLSKRNLGGLAGQGLCGAKSNEDLLSGARRLNTIAFLDR
jgi:hypothetical protein